MIAQIDKNYVKSRFWKVWSRMVSYALFEGRPITTKGQWINPLVFFLFSLHKRFPQLRRIKEPIFILGTGRSGTTILGVVLSVHKDVGFLNEPKALWHSIFKDEDLIGSYSLNNARYRLSSEDASSDVKKNAHRLFSSYLSFSLSNRVVDKYPELLFRVPFVKSIFPDAKFLFLVRNGFETCASIDNWSSRLGEKVDGAIHDWWGVDRRKWSLLVNQIVPEHPDLLPYCQDMKSWNRHTDMAAVEWIVSMREGLKLVNDYPNDILRVDYESLCREPRTELLKICDFANLDKNDATFFDYGQKVLRERNLKPPLDLDEAILYPFLDTMRSLGYEC